MSPIVSSTAFYAPNVAKQLEQERFAEEQVIRREYTAQLAAAEKTARAKFESDLTAKRAAAWGSFESGLTTEEDKSTFASDLAAQEAAARSTFESQLAAERERVRQTFQTQIGLRRGQLVEAPLRAAKREYAMTYKQQMLPRHYRAIRSGAEETFKGLAEAEQKGFEQQVSTWETGEAKTFTSEILSWKSTEIGKQQEAVKDWETSQRSVFEQSLKDWETEVRSSFEAEVSSWKKEQQQSLESQFVDWEKAWQPKGAAERMMEIKVPSLDLGGKIAEALGTKPVGWTPQGMRYGGVVWTPEGVQPYKAVVAPLAGAAGVVASVESLVYGVGQLAGLKTPRMPPTLTGGLISSGIESAMKGQWVASSEMQQISRMGAAYAYGSVMGDILVSYGIGKAVKAGTKAVKGVAGFLYEESGLKYSHALYEAKELSLAISEHLPKSPLAAIEQSDLAYELSRAGSWIKHKIMPIKLMEVPAEGIVGLPTLEEEVPKGIAAFKEGAKISKALETATGVGVTPLEYGKAVYPKIFAGMELLGWTEAPKTVGFGLTKAAVETGKESVKSALSEALAETIWIGAGAGERWAVRAGVIPSLEDVIVQPPKEAGEQMIKGGRYFDIDVTRALGFSKLPYKEAAVGKLFFEKEKLPSLKDLLKGVKAETTLASLLESPARAVQPILPTLAMLPEVAGRVSVSQAVGVAAVLGLKPLSKQRLKPEAIVKPSSLAAEILSFKVEPAAAQKLKVGQVSLLKEIVAPSQLLKTISAPRGIFRLPPLLPKPKKKEEPLKRIKRVIFLGKKPKKKMAGFLYPVLPEEKLPRFLLGKTEVSKYILGKPLSPKRHHRSR